MAYETRDNSGTLGRNDRCTSDKHPTHKGKVRIDGVDYWVSAWVKEAGPQSKNPGSKFFSLSFERCEQQAQGDIPFGADTPQAAQQPRSGHGGAQGMSGHGHGATGAPGGDYDDSIPF